MTPAAWSSRPEMGLKRAGNMRLVYGEASNAIAGNSAVPVWHKALGGLGASASGRTAHWPLNAWAPLGRPPAASESNVQRPGAAAALADGEGAGAAGFAAGDGEALAATVDAADGAGELAAGAVVSGA